MRKLRIKLEVDTNPPAGATYDMPVLDYPFLSAVRVFDLPSLFAGKMHALLCREYLKGRDWYDFVWYTARRTPINYALLSAALDQQGPWKGMRPATDNAWCVATLTTAIEAIDWNQARRDVERFLKPHELPPLQLWTPEFFMAQCSSRQEHSRVKNQHDARAFWTGSTGLTGWWEGVAPSYMYRELSHSSR